MLGKLVPLPFIKKSMEEREKRGDFHIIMIINFICPVPRTKRIINLIIELNGGQEFRGEGRGVSSKIPG